MAEYPGSHRVTGYIAPSDTTDTYATHKSVLGHGGHREVDLLTDRDAITTDRRNNGMTCYVQETKHVYQLIGGIENSNWVDITAKFWHQYCGVETLPTLTNNGDGSVTIGNGGVYLVHTSK